MISRSIGPVSRRVLAALGLTAGLATAGLGVVALAAPGGAAATGCTGDNGGITLSPGFCATVFADNLGHVRHLAFGPGGVLYANVWSGRYYPEKEPPKDPFLVALKDANGDGRADQVSRFGPTAAEGAGGGTGVAVYRGALYAEQDDKIVRYVLPAAGGAPTGKGQVVLSGMPLTGDHPMHPFVIDARGQLIVNVGSATNSCDTKNRAPETPGVDPCVELDTRAGLWRYDANKTGQVFSAKERYVTGLRNSGGQSFDAAGRLFAVQHGRDQLPANWPKLYADLPHATELPAEELVLVSGGADYGWPRCYYDSFQKKLVLAPEYGGDGGKAVGACASKTGPVAAFPAHWAPNDLALYDAKAFPGPYQGGAFIAFHGSWNRAPAPQDGYNVVFQPMKDGKAAGDYVVFADGFAGAAKDPGRAAFRPAGLAIGPDGALYIADDVKGRIWRVTYHGSPNLAAIAAAPRPTATTPAPAAPPRAEGGLPVPPGATAAQVATGRTLFAGSTCIGCHGVDAKGTPLGPDLTTGTWLWGDGSLGALAKVIDEGVAEPKRFRAAMPPKGGAQLDNEQLTAVAAYVWAVGHQARQ